MYAVIETGGKQYKVREGDTVDVELLGGEAGDTIELDQVLMVAGDDGLTVGTPTVEGAAIRATVVDEVKGDKIVVFKYKPKNRYARKTGHRQKYTRLQIDKILLPGAEEETTAATEEAPVAEAPTAEAAEPIETAPEAEVVAEPDTVEETMTEAVDEPAVAEEPAAKAAAEAPAAEASIAEAVEPAEAKAVEERETVEETAAEETDEPTMAGEPAAEAEGVEDKPTD